MFERIPVSLRLDTEAEYYTEVVAPLKSNRELSGFLVTVLKAYHASEDVRASLAPFLDENIEVVSTFERVLEAIDTISATHSKSAAITNMISDQHKELFDKLAGQAGYVRQDMLPHESDNSSPNLVEMKLGSRSAESDSSVQSVTYNQNPTTIVEETGTPSSDQPSMSSPDNGENISTSGSPVPTVPSFVLFEEENLEPNDSESHPISSDDSESQKSPAFAPTLSLPTLSDDEDELLEEVQEVAQSNKPSSFGKAFNSIKKK